MDTRAGHLGGCSPIASAPLRKDACGWDYVLGLTSLLQGICLVLLFCLAGRDGFSGHGCKSFTRDREKEELLASQCIRDCAQFEMRKGHVHYISCPRVPGTR